MSNTISANTLFHFTRSIDNLIGILTDDFAPRFCMENQSFISRVRKSRTEYAIPMVCFCDIPLSQIKNHINNYGGYAIGLSKDWGKRNGINPVMYAVEDSVSSEILNDTIDMLYNNVMKDESLVAIDGLVDVKREIKSSWKKIYDFTSFIKPYEGKRWNGSSFDGEIVRFYDEREWRYVPDIRNMDNLKDIIAEGLKSTTLKKEEYLDDTKRNKYNSIIGKYVKLKFTPNDINYIIVKSENEVLEIQDKIIHIKEDKYTHKDLRGLTTRILCCERVLEDF